MIRSFIRNFSFSLIKGIAIIAVFLIIVLRIFFCVESSYYDFAFNSISLYKFFNFYILLILGILLYIHSKFNFKKFVQRHKDIMVFIYSMIISIAFLLLFKGTPQYDSQSCVEVADLIVNNNFLGKIDSDYLLVYPFQYGYAFFIACFKYLFNDYFLFCLQVFQAVVYSLANVYLQRIVRAYFCSKGNVFQIVIVIAWIVPYCLSTYVYGLSLGLSCVIFSIYNIFNFIKKVNKNSFILAIVFSILACFVKPNFIILVVTYFLYFAFIYSASILKKIIISFICFVNIIFSLNVVKFVGNTIFEADLGDGVDQFSFLIMSTIDNSLIEPKGMYYVPPGYHTGYETLNYTQYDGDIEKISEHNTQIFKNQVQYSIEHPNRFIKYYGLKYLATWASSDFMILLQYANRVDELLIKQNVDFLEDGFGKFINTLLINLSVLIIFLGTFIYMFNIDKDTEDFGVILLIYFIGGVLYHLLFEAKSIYVYPYITMLIPVSIKGFSLISKTSLEKITKYPKLNIVVSVVMIIFTFYYNQSNSYTAISKENYYDYPELINLNKNSFVTYEFDTGNTKNINGMELYIEGDLGDDELIICLTGENLEKYYSYQKGQSENDNYIRINFDKGLLKTNKTYELTLSVKCNNQISCDSNITIPVGLSSTQPDTAVTYNGKSLESYTLNFKLFSLKQSNLWFYDKNVVNPISRIYYNF